MPTKVLTVGNLKAFNGRRPVIKISGFWLNEIGFHSNKLLSIQYETGSLYITVSGEGSSDYLTLAREIRKNNKGRLVQVSNSLKNKVPTPSFEVKGEWLRELGFEIWDVVVVNYEYGSMTIKVLDFETQTLSSKRVNI